MNTKEEEKINEDIEVGHWDQWLSKPKHTRVIVEEVNDEDMSSTSSNSSDDINSEGSRKSGSL